MGDALCTRVLMDTAVTRKHISSQVDKFCMQIGTSLARVCFENRDVLKERIARRGQFAIERKQDVDSLRDECGKCHAEGRTSCFC